MYLTVLLIGILLWVNPINGDNVKSVDSINPIGEFLEKEKLTLPQYIEQFPFEEYPIYKVKGVGDFYIDEAKDFVKNQLRKGQAWENRIIAILRQYIIPGSIVVDIGAFNGVHTVTMGKAVGKGKVFAFEPQLKIYRELVMNTRLNKLKNVSAWHCGVSNISGQAHLCFDPRNESGTWVGECSDVVEMRSLDSFNLKNVSLMKIDAEGHEDQVLDGAIETILTNRPVLVIEIQGGWDIDKAPENIRQNILRTKAKLEQLDYSLRRLSPHDYLALPEGASEPRIPVWQSKNKGS